MRTNRSRLVLLLALAGACAPAGTASPGARVEGPSPSFQGDSPQNIDVRLSTDDPRMSRPFRATPTQLWMALPTIYGILGIRAEVVDSARLAYGSTRISQNQIGGKRLGSYFRCGNDGAGPSAMSRQRYRVTVLTTLQPTGTGTLVTTKVEGSATPVDGGSGNVTYCASTGELEHTIAELLEARTGG